MKKNKGHYSWVFLVFTAIALTQSLSLQAAPSSYYVEGSVGSTQVDYRYFKGFSQFDVSDTSLALTGGASFNDNFGFEISYFEFGDQEDRLTGPGLPDLIASVESRYLGVTAVGSYPITPRWKISGKLGLGWYDVAAEYLVTDTGREFSADDRDVGFHWGVGTDYRFNRLYGLKLEYQQFLFDAPLFSRTTTINAISIGFRRYF